MPDFELAKGPEGLARISAELERQAAIYGNLGVPKDTIMRLVAPRPDNLPKELTIPVVTLGKSVNLKHQADFVGMETMYSLSSGYDTAGGITFDAPHLIWMQKGSKYMDKSVEWVRNHLESNERPATQHDGVALAIVNPDFREWLRYRNINLPGTTVQTLGLPLYAPYMSCPEGWIELNMQFSTFVFRGFGSASSGS